MREIAASPFEKDGVTLTTTLEDTAFRYQPNILCSACRELLMLGLELRKQRGRQMAEEVYTKYTFGDMVASADLGCHLCALLKTSMLGVSSNQLVPASSWDVTFSVQRSSKDGALYQITLVCAGPQGAGGTIHRGHLLVYPKDGAAATETDSPTPDPSSMSLGRNTGDEETLGVAEEWLGKCLAEHPLCGENDDEARIVRPARLLKLDNTIKLVDSVEAEGQEYVTLSHCWGKQTYVPRLLFDTEAKLRGGVDIEYLPRTFQDAVTITRKLGYEYIWIDSLCIIQDSAKDWEEQAKIMALVYVNSIFTIAALKSPGSSGGCFTGERNPLGLRPIVSEDLGITIRPSAPSELWETEVNTSGYGASPLHTRSWVVQERLSSPRTLLYGAFGVYWECRCAQASESHHRKVSWEDNSNKKTWLQKLEAGWADLPKDTALYKNGWMGHWIDLLKTYSSCELTMKTDKIIAVTGLISELERRSQSHKRCILGLWAHDLPGMLLWYRSRNDMIHPTDEVGRLDNGMPTWTWASVEGRCSYLSATGTIEWQTTAEVDESSTPASMAINTWRRKVLIDEDNALLLDPDDPRTGQKGWGGDLDETSSWFPDCEMPAPDQELYAVSIQRARVVDKPPIWVARCLVITPEIQTTDQGQTPVFIRVGVVTIRFSDGGDDPFKSKDLGAREVIFLR
ncbi:heterokaryon incompatibility protein [Seiridium cupressi]